MIWFQNPRRGRMSGKKKKEKRKWGKKKKKKKRNRNEKRREREIRKGALMDVGYAVMYWE